MKSFLITLSFLMTFQFIGKSQTDFITYDKHIKYSFERLDSSKSSELAQGSFITIQGNATDTNILYKGYFMSADEHSIQINCQEWHKNKDWQPEGSHGTYYYSESYYFSEDEVIRLEFENIESIKRENRRPDIPAFVASTGITAAVFAPLFCINKNNEHRFNVKRYVDILKYSALAVVSGSVVAGILSSNKKYILKPKLLRKP